MHLLISKVAAHVVEHITFRPEALAAILRAWIGSYI